jgi:protein RecA
MSERSDKLMAFLGKSKKAWGEGKIEIVNDAKAIHVHRFSSGVFSLDLALGGGFPWGRFVLVHGPEAAGKTSLCTMACASIARLSAETRLPIPDDSPLERCRALYVDQESVFNSDWGKCLGFDPAHHCLARPETGEEAIDIITAALAANVFDAIVLDSIAACTPSKELEGAAGDAAVGVQARLMNQAFRKWQPELTKLGDRAPVFFLTNQNREKIGVLYGSPLTLPGGKAQMFYPSIRIAMSPSKTVEDDNKLLAISHCSGSVKKNKTYCQGLDFEFDLAMRDSGFLTKGQVNNAYPAFRHGKSLGLIGHEFATGRMIEDVVATAAKKNIVKAGGGDPSSVTPVLKSEVVTTRTDDEMIEFLHRQPYALKHLIKQIFERSFT